jgi:hypothetical protein
VDWPGVYVGLLQKIVSLPQCRANETLSQRRLQTKDTAILEKETQEDFEKEIARDVNADPLTGAHGSHPVGTGIGATGGAVAGAAAGAVVGGPLGAVIGAAIGGVAGGAAGHGVGEAVNPTLENTYWETNYRSRPYVDRTRPYADYQDAYRYGWESRLAHPGRQWTEVETDLAKGWPSRQSKSSLLWNQAKGATQDAWNRVEKVVPGDSDRDGR